MFLFKNLKFFAFSGFQIKPAVKAFNDVVDRKLAVQDNKNIKFEKWQNWLFWKLVSPWFWSKICFFMLCVLDQIGP